MAKLMSKKTREIVQTISVLVLVALLIAFYAIYPLLYVPDLVSRPNADNFKDPEYMPVNNPAFFLEAGLNPDTLTFLTNDNIRLAALSFGRDSSLYDSAAGTVIMLHPDDTDRTALVEYITPLIDSGLNVIIYDQRACGLSGGLYHFAGDYEGDDLVELIANLNIHEKLVYPIIAIGFGLGGDAVIKGGYNENRISTVIAVDPYLSSSRWIDERKKLTGVLSIPLNNIVYHWWFQKLSGYPFDRTCADDIIPVTIPTILFMSENKIDSDEIIRIKEISLPKLLTIKAAPSTDSELRREIITEIFERISEARASSLKQISPN
jgi:hypothetical protein